MLREFYSTDKEGVSERGSPPQRGRSVWVSERVIIKVVVPSGGGVDPVHKPIGLVNLLLRLGRIVCK